MDRKSELRIEKSTKLQEIGTVRMQILKLQTKEIKLHNDILAIEQELKTLV